MRWLALCALAGCAANLDTPGGETFTVRGRVVDAESCASEAGCTGMAGLVVSLFADPDRVRSEPTGLDGTFELHGVPVGYPHDLIVTADVTATESVAPTLNPMVVSRDQEEDVFGLEIYVMRSDPASLIQTIRQEGVELVLGGGYFGQVVQVDGSTVTAAQGASAVVAPAPRSLRYVNSFPRYFQDQVPPPTALQSSDATTTNNFGAFVVEAEGPTDPGAFLPMQAGWEYDLVVAPMVPGFVTYALHRGVPVPPP